MLFGSLFGKQKTATGAGAAQGGQRTAGGCREEVHDPRRDERTRQHVPRLQGARQPNGTDHLPQAPRHVEGHSGRGRAVKEGRPSEGEIGVKIVHPHVVRTYEYGTTIAHEYYIVMEFLNGQSLTFIRESRPFQLAERLELLAQAAEGLAAIHAAGFVHHDFGPRNLLVNREDQVKIIDFGLAVPNTPTFHRPGNRTGTLIYMAPELVRREATDERLDLFSFGATAFEFLSNRLPYDVPATNSMAQAQRINLEPLDLAKINPKLPADLCDLIRGTLARRKEDRRPKPAALPGILREIAARHG